MHVDTRPDTINVNFAIHNLANNMFNYTNKISAADNSYVIGAFTQKYPHFIQSKLYDISRVVSIFNLKIKFILNLIFQFLISIFRVI